MAFKFDPLNPVNSLLGSAAGQNSQILDFLSNYRFHVMDVSFTMPQVFSLTAGFRFVSAPEISVDIKEFKEGTFEYPRKVIMGAKIPDIVMHRGVKFTDSDFYDWINGAIKGSSDLASASPTPLSEFRRNLLLIQYSNINTGIGGGGIFGSGPLSFLNFSSITQLANFVPARAWMLYDCIPVNYKSGTDFDGVGADVSIAELTVAPRFVEEYNTGL